MDEPIYPAQVHCCWSYVDETTAPPEPWTLGACSDCQRPIIMRNDVAIVRGVAQELGAADCPHCCVWCTSEWLKNPIFYNATERLAVYGAGRAVRKAYEVAGIAWDPEKRA